MHGQFTTIGYLGNKNQQNDCSGPNEDAETCDSSKTVDPIIHGVDDNEVNNEHKGGEVSSQDNLLVVIQPLNICLPGFEGHYNCHTL